MCDSFMEVFSLTHRTVRHETHISSSSLYQSHFIAQGHFLAQLPNELILLVIPHCFCQITVSPEVERLHIVSHRNLQGTLEGVYNAGGEILLDVAQLQIESTLLEPYYWKLPQRFQGSKVQHSTPNNRPMGRHKLSLRVIMLNYVQRIP